MQFPASDRARSPDRYVVRLSDALAALLGRGEGAELPEDELLGRLREWGLITYPSPLLGGLLEKLTEVLAAEVLPQLGPTDLAVVGRVGVASQAAVVASGLPRAGANGDALLKVEDFVGSVQRLAWAKANGCPWVARTSAHAARSGRVEVLRWAREHGCDWDEWTCMRAARGGHLEVLRWPREHGCPWMEVDQDVSEYTMNCCTNAGAGGHLEVLKWLRVQGCPWDEVTCAEAAAGGHLQVLMWAREHGCPWVEMDEDDTDCVMNCCALAAQSGHLEVLKWLRENDCPWDAWTCACAAEGGHLEVLKWAREHHCPWDHLTRQYAEEKRHLELLQWAVEHGAPA